MLSKFLNKTLVIWLFFAGFFSCNNPPENNQTTRNYGINKTNGTAIELMAAGSKKLRLRDYYGAKIEFDKAIKTDPNYSPIYSYRAETRLQMGDSTGALYDYSIAVRLSPNKAQCYIDRGDMFLMLKRYEFAIIDYTKSLELDSTKTRTYMKRATSYYKLQNFPTALTDLETAIRQNPTYGLAYYYRAIVRKALGEKAGACEDISKAQQLGIHVDAEKFSAYCSKVLY